MILTTKRLALREMRQDDLDFLASMLGDPIVMKHYPKPLNREEANGWLERTLGCYARAGHGFWIVEHRETNERVGQVGLLPKEINGNSEIEVAYMIQKDFWNQGIATEAAIACRDYAFSVLKVPRVVLMIRPENLASLEVANKLGVQRIGETIHLGLLHNLYECRPK